VWRKQSDDVLHFSANYNAAHAPVETRRFSKARSDLYANRVKVIQKRAALRFAFASFLPPPPHSKARTFKFFCVEKINANIRAYSERIFSDRMS